MQSSPVDNPKLREHPPVVGCLAAVLAHPDFAREIWQLQEFKDGALILSEGDTSGNLYVVSAGSVRIEGTVRLDSGRRFQAGVTRLSVGGVCGELSLFDRQPHSAMVFADGATTILATEGPALPSFLDAHPAEGYAVFKKFLTQMAPRLQTTSHRVCRFPAWGLKAYHQDA